MEKSGTEEVTGQNAEEMRAVRLGKKGREKEHHAED